MDNYNEYINNQIVVHGQVKKPLKYRLGQRRAIDWFFEDVPKNVSILDVGCGEGTGLQYLSKLGYEDLMGIDLHPKKIEICKRRGYTAVCDDVLLYDFGEKKFDVVWMSHSFEHMLKPTETVEKLIKITSSDADIFIIVPYPDVGPSTAHCASDLIGTRIDDRGNAFITWLIKNGLVPYVYKFDAFREMEIWVQAKKG